jgi:hypothetical protein
MNGPVTERCVSTGTEVCLQRAGDRTRFDIDAWTNGYETSRVAYAPLSFVSDMDVFAVESLLSGDGSFRPVR